MEANAGIMRTLLILLSALNAAVLLLTIAQPALDHHFAERVPGHSHIAGNALGPAWQSGWMPAHTHPYEHPHTHPYPVGDNEPVAVTSAVAVIAADAGSSSAGFDLMGSWLLPIPYPMLPGGHDLVWSFPDRISMPHTVTPPERPPRAVS